MLIGFHCLYDIYTTDDDDDDDEYRMINQWLPGEHVISAADKRWGSN